MINRLLLVRDSFFSVQRNIFIYVLLLLRKYWKFSFFNSSFFLTFLFRWKTFYFFLFRWVALTIR